MKKGPCESHSLVSRHGTAPQQEGRLRHLSVAFLASSKRALPRDETFNGLLPKAVPGRSEVRVGAALVRLPAVERIGADDHVVMAVAVHVAGGRERGAEQGVALITLGDPRRVASPSAEPKKATTRPSSRWSSS